MDIKPVKKYAKDKAALRTADFFEERREHADIDAALDVMSRERGEMPKEGDAV
jgi:hypothetical protein